MRIAKEFHTIDNRWISCLLYIIRNKWNLFVINFLKMKTASLPYFITD